MAPEPLVKPLSLEARTWIFWVLLAIFCIAMPVFVFYAMGYRIDFANDRTIITVGGMYIGAEAEDTFIFVNEEPVENMRLFQRAAYIQNLASGMHRVHVQRDGLHTWVKELPVYPRIVTEAHAFNMPEVPQIRYIPEWLTEAGIPVFMTEQASTTSIVSHASTTNTFLATTSTRTTAYTANSEYEFAESLFAPPATTEPRRALDLISTGTDQTEVAEVATTTKIMRDVTLFEENGEVYARWIGSEHNIPYYYCVMYTSPEVTSREYGAHVYESILMQFGTTTDLISPTETEVRLCRDTIRIDRIGQEVLWFDFLPGSMHHVLMLLEDGLYVVEIDDRAWQNVQRLYPGEDLSVRVDGGQIYVFDGEYYFEILTEIAT